MTVFVSLEKMEKTSKMKKAKPQMAAAVLLF